MKYIKEYNSFSVEQIKKVLKDQYQIKILT